MDVFWCLRHVPNSISFVSGDAASTDPSPSGATHERNTAVGVDKGAKGMSWGYKRSLVSLFTLLITDYIYTIDIQWVKLKIRKKKLRRKNSRMSLPPRLSILASNTPSTYTLTNTRNVFFDLDIAGEKAGRIIFKLYDDIVPKVSPIPPFLRID